MTSVLLGIVATLLAVIFAYQSYRMNQDRKEAERNALHQEQELQKLAQEVRKTEAEHQEKIELKESLATGNGSADFNSSIELLHDLAAKRTGTKN